MEKELFIAVVLAITFSIKDADALDCCGAYTDILGNHHKSQLCTDYCCLRADIAYKDCCNNPLLQIPASDNQNAQCVKNWIKEHIWVPIGGGIVGLIILVGICICCYRRCC